MLRAKSHTISLALATILFLPLIATRPAQADPDPAASHAQVDKLATKTDFDLSAQPLGTALKQFADQAGVQILFEENVVEGLRAPAIKAHESGSRVLEMLLNHTDLEYTAKDQTVAVRKKISRGATTAATHRSTTRESSPGSGQFMQNDPDSSQVPQGPGQISRGYSRAPQEETGSRIALQEITVTAQKQTQSLMDVPVPVTAINATRLVQENHVRLADYFTSIPGLMVTPADGTGAPALNIRGITSGGNTNPTVGIVVDDVPYGSSTSLGIGPVAPDIDPSTLARVEVLRGPQGSLYGASSIGGLLKFVTVDPSTDTVSGQVHFSGNGVRNGTHLGYGVGASLNVPVSDTLAVLATGSTRRDPGYIDNLATHTQAANRVDVDTGRVSVLWKPTDTVSVKLSAMLQEAHGYGAPQVLVGPGYGDLEQSDVAGTGGYSNKAQVYSANVKAKLGTFDLTAISGYAIDSTKNAFDYTFAYADTTTGLFGVPNTALLNQFKTDRFTQELRATTPIGSRLDWLMGAYFDREVQPLSQRQDFVALNSDGEFVGRLFFATFPSTFEEYAVFTDLTYRITNRFEVQVGARESQNRQTYSQEVAGPLVGGDYLTPEIRSQDNSFTYLLSPSYRITTDTMIYARLASGYRPGGPNTNIPSLNLPLTYKPDTTRNYELGVKGRTLDHRLSFDASLYYIDWRDIQLAFVTPSGFGYNGNGGRARSAGIEFAAQGKPTTGLTIGGWVAANTAVLTESLPSGSAVYGASGDRLPSSSRFAGSLTIEQRFGVIRGFDPFVGGSISYIGDRLGSFNPTPPADPPRQDLPAYTEASLRAGVERGSWIFSSFVNNITDRRGMLSGGIGTSRPDGFQYIQPRTIGLSVSGSF